MKRTYANNFGIENGQIYIAAGGSRSGHVVTDASDVDFIVTRPFVGDTWGAETEIDGFKLAMERYAMVDAMPAWGPSN